MGNIRKVGDIYYIEFFARGLMYSQVAGNDLAAAEKLLKETEAKIAGGEALTVVREIDLPVFFERFLSFSNEEFGVKSSRRFKMLIEHFSGFLKERFPTIQRLSQLTPSIMEEYKVYLILSTDPKLVNFSILLLREIMEFGIKIGFINDNPTIHVSLLKVPSNRLANHPRNLKAKELFEKRISFRKIYQLLGLKDIAQMMHYRNFIPLSREDMYN